jgi:hypothetical protein
MQPLQLITLITESDERGGLELDIQLNQTPDEQCLICPAFTSSGAARPSVLAASLITFIAPHTQQNPCVLFVCFDASLKHSLSSK